MPRDLTGFLWALKLGVLVNLAFLARTFVPPGSAVDPHLLVPAQIFLAVSAFRCLFPVGYRGKVVLHDTPLSSIFLTRLLATFSEVAYIYQFSHVLRLLNADDVGWVDLLSWLMVLHVVVSQLFVWGAILGGRPRLYFFEELGWALLFVWNTLASAYLYLTLDGLAGREILLQLNLLFGLVYLPWQVLHLRAQLSRVGDGPEGPHRRARTTGAVLWDGLRRSLHERNRTGDAAAWGGWIGLTWMIGYWATLIPAWVHQVVVVFSR